MNRFASAGLCAALLLVPAAARPADTPTGADLLPDTTAFYAEVPAPGRLIDAVADHPLRKRVEQSDAYRKATATPQYLVFQFVVAAVESKLGQGLRPAVKSATGRGIAVAFDAKTEGAVLLVHAEDKDALERLVSTLRQLTRDDAKNKGKPDPIEEDSYRDLTIYGVNGGGYAVKDEWLVATNKGDLGKYVLDRLIDGGGSTLAAQPRFQEARGRLAGEPAAWAWLDMQAVRAKVGGKGPLATGHTDNPLAELLVGGLVDDLRKTPYVTAAFTLDAERASLAVASPHDPAWVSESRAYFFGGSGTGSPAPLQAGQTLLTIGTYRDISQMWLRAGDLFDQKMADELAKADSGLTTIFGGRDFGEEVLGSIGPELRFVAVRQDFTVRKPTPAVKLPAFALVGTIKDPQVMRGELRRAFLSLVGFLNIATAQNGQPQLDFDIEKNGDDQTIVTRPLPEASEAESTSARINFNFSPTVAFIGDQVIVSSTERLARELSESVRKPAEPNAPRRPNSLIEVEGQALHDVLADNREQLVTRNMLSEGRSRQEAEQAIDALLAGVGLLHEAKLSLDAADGRVELRLDVDWEK